MNVLFASHSSVCYQSCVLDYSINFCKFVDWKCLFIGCLIDNCHLEDLDLYLFVGQNDLKGFGWISWSKLCSLCEKFTNCSYWNCTPIIFEINQSIVTLFLYSSFITIAPFRLACTKGYTLISGRLPNYRILILLLDLLINALMFPARIIMPKWFSLLLKSDCLSY